ncbi:MAG: 1,4-dihydroxy-2-naphthoate polyprenyltransferase [Thermoanaerobaculia bacterium]
MANRWLLAARPKTLSAAAVPVLIGSALAEGTAQGAIWWVFVCALAGALLIQIATNLINDALDFKKGTDTEDRLGPVRVTAAGLVSPEAVMRGAWSCLAGAVLFGLPLIWRGGWPILAIGLLSIAGAYVYTGGPYPLAYHGLGEIFVMIFFGLVAVGGTFWAHTLTMSSAVAIGGIAAGALATVLLVINNLRDVDGDRRSRKLTTVVRFGERFARAEIALLTLLPFACAIAIAWIRTQWWILLPLAALPLAIVLLRRVAVSTGVDLNRCLAMAGGLQWLFGLLFAIGAIVR